MMDTTNKTENFNNDDAAYIAFVIRYDPIPEELYADTELEHTRFLAFFDRAPVGDEIDQVVLC
ncbi:hypothetical protein Acife_1908 [Acidithiobacillus ferrivorans SS3]|uniref:Uncharacterized protein n=1 Tax=Acidithiobacillus ferrivorans SS3 TaxID=743299 RepID=G0JLI2_9PROT|nr:hypothetical protein [Acidithiobacillus ferrivorans]AEM48031.1 hypothetical protein Acife_1908 [Acidithiobacillus ferrivorans SS3]